MSVNGCDFEVDADAHVAQVYFTYTFRRNTPVDEFKYRANKFEHPNHILADIRDKFAPTCIVTYEPLTLEKVKHEQEEMESYGHDPYSEYEQSIMGSVKLTPKSR